MKNWFRIGLTKTTIAGTLLLIALAVVLHGDTPPDPIGQRFHYETSFDHTGYLSDTPHWGSQVPQHKSYPDARRVSLKLEEEDGPSTPGGTLAGLLNARKSVRSYADRPVSFEQLSRLLLSANGATRVAGGSARRTAPSAGALYPIDVYVVAKDVTDLSPGLYYFNVADSALLQIQARDVSATLSAAAPSQPWVGPAPATLILASRFDRVTTKYADRGYRYAYIECGAICQNIYLQATALGLGTVAVGAFNDVALNDLLEADGVREAGLLIMPIGVQR
jgi:SagB-type dehydrogenase family enzyme